MDEILLVLLKHGAYLKPVRMSTSSIGAETGMSQQNASRKVLILEKEGYVERSKAGVKLTRKAYDELAVTFSTLKKIFEGEHIEIEGMIVKGLGEGNFYVSMDGYRKQIKEKLSFEPYPGTLNLRIEDEDAWKKQHLLQMEPVIISGFKDRNRSYGDLFAYKCRIDGRDCALVVPIRTHHGPEIIEIISSFNIKKELGKNDGDRVKVVL